MVRSVDAIYRFIPFVFFGFLFGCGGLPRSEQPVKSIQWQSAVDGGYVAGCLRGEQLTAARSHSIERWAFAVGERPKRRSVHRLEPLGMGAVSGLHCEGEVTVIETTDGRLLSLGPAGIAPCKKAHDTLCGHSPIKPLEKAGDVTVPVTDKSGTQWEAALPDGRLLVLGPWGRGLRDGTQYVDWRPAPGRLRDATFDGRSIWAVGEGGLWRWIPGLPSARPIALPAALSGKPLVGAFRDGPLLWVRDQEQAGWPLSLSGGSAHLVGAPGVLPHRALDATVQLGQWQVAATRGEKGLRFTDDAERTTRVDTLPITMLAPLDNVHFLVGDREHLTLWTLSESGPPRRLQSWSLGGATLRVFVDKERIYAVGVPYGIITGSVLSITEKRTRQSQ